MRHATLPLLAAALAVALSPAGTTGAGWSYCQRFLRPLAHDPESTRADERPASQRTASSGCPTPC